jgi:hypothetical protein
MAMKFIGRHDNQYNDTHYNDTQPSNKNATLSINVSVYSETGHNDTRCYVSFTLSVEFYCYSECRYAECHRSECHGAVHKSLLRIRYE